MVTAMHVIKVDKQGWLSLRKKEFGQQRLRHIVVSLLSLRKKELGQQRLCHIVVSYEFALPSSTNSTNTEFELHNELKKAT